MYDAGVDSATTFIHTNAATSPPALITSRQTASVATYVLSVAGAPFPGASKDPHFHFAHGGRADIRGEDGGIYNFLSAKNVTMNVEFAAADFVWSHRTVHVRTPHPSSPLPATSY